MNSLITMARMTFLEATRRKILWTALGAAVILLAIFAIALHLQVVEFRGRPMSPFVRYQVESGMLLIGLYTCALLAVVMTILTSIDTIAGEISSSTIHAIAKIARRITAAPRAVHRIRRRAASRKVTRAMISNSRTRSSFSS